MPYASELGALNANSQPSSAFPQAPAHMPYASELGALNANSQPSSAFPQAPAQAQPRHGMCTALSLAFQSMAEQMMC